jgi:spore maturation protein SpmA
MSAGAPQPAALSLAEAPRPEPLPPAWTTSEFWSTLLVHAIAVVTIVLTFTTGSSNGVQGAEAIVPAAALLMSAVAHAVYVRGRVNLKLGHLRLLAGRIDAEVRSVEPMARQFAPVVVAEDPALAQRIAAAVAAGRAVGPASTPGPANTATPAQ